MSEMISEINGCDEKSVEESDLTEITAVCMYVSIHPSIRPVFYGYP